MRALREILFLSPWNGRKSIGGRKKRKRERWRKGWRERETERKLFGVGDISVSPDGLLIQTYLKMPFGANWALMPTYVKPVDVVSQYINISFLSDETVLSAYSDLALPLKLISLLMSF